MISALPMHGKTDGHQKCLKPLVKRQGSRTTDGVKKFNDEDQMFLGTSTMDNVDTLPVSHTGDCELIAGKKCTNFTKVELISASFTNCLKRGKGAPSNPNSCCYLERGTRIRSAFSVLQAGTASTAIPFDDFLLKNPMNSQLLQFPNI